MKYDDNKEKSFLICLAPVAQSVSASYLYVSIDKEMRRSGVRASPGARFFTMGANWEPVGAHVNDILGFVPTTLEITFYMPYILLLLFP